MKLFIKPALFLMPLAFLNLGAMDRSGVSEIMADGSEAPLSPANVHINTVADQRAFNGKEYDFSNVLAAHRDGLWQAFLDKEMSEKDLNYVLNRASKVIGSGYKAYGNGRIEKYVYFNDVPYRFVYHINGISKPWSLESKLFLMSGIGALVGAYYYRDSLKPIVQNFWDKQVMPRASALFEYLKRK